MGEIIRLVVVLGAICSFSAGTLAYVRTSLAPRIEMQEDFYVRGPALERLFQQPALEMLSEKLTYTVSDTNYPVFYRRAGGEVTGMAIEAVGRGGYGGDIVFMIGLDPTQDKVIGVEIVSHSETPGVGAKVELESFREQWKGLILNEPVGLISEGGQLDAITGATYSSNAMVDGTNRVAGLLQSHKEEILSLIIQQSSESPASGGDD
jgi:H+/Na+-translocating ferredoxin:NAD+ oxidoreductase subunit G